MVARNSGVILTLTATPARTATPLVGGMAPAWAGVEALTRSLAAELGPNGVRALCIRSHAIPQTTGRRANQHGMDMQAKSAGISREEMQHRMEGQTLLHRLPTLAQVADVAAFLASNGAGAMTGAVVNVSAGSIVD
jgi:enoyl-[acyl-carrier-protein] reductase (NADH)